MYVFSLLLTLKHLVSLFNTAWVVIAPHLKPVEILPSAPQDTGCEHPRVWQWQGFVPRVHDLETFMFLSLWDEEKDNILSAGVQ